MKWQSVWTWRPLALLIAVLIADYFACLHPPFLLSDGQQLQEYFVFAIATAGLVVFTHYFSLVHIPRQNTPPSKIFGVAAGLTAVLCIMYACWFVRFTHELPDHCSRKIVGWELTPTAKQYMLDNEPTSETRMLLDMQGDVERAYTSLSLNIVRVSGVVLWILLFPSLTLAVAALVVQPEEKGVSFMGLDEQDLRAVRQDVKAERSAEENATTAERLYRISALDRKAKFNLVFLHGVDGHWRSTWEVFGQSDTFWPEWIAQDFPDLDVWSLHYNASTLHWKFSGGTMPLQDRAGNAIVQLDAEGIFARPTMFIVHSFGGLVFKSMWREACDRDRKDIRESVKSVVFLATPHTGASLASYLQLFFLKLPLRPTVTVEDLRLNDAHLRNLNTWYINHPIDKNYVFFETQPIAKIAKIGLVVDEASASLNLRGVFPTAIYANHISICKPASRDEVLYKTIKNAICETFA